MVSILEKRKNGEYRAEMRTSDQWEFQELIEQCDTSTRLI